MSYLEDNLRHFIANMKSDIFVTEEHLGDDPRMSAVASAQKAFVAELEDIVNDASGHEDFSDTYEAAALEMDMGWEE